MYYKVSNPDIKYTVAAHVNESDDGIKVVGNYRVGHEMGSGSFGTVYRVQHMETNQEYAMKEYHKASLRKHAQSIMMKTNHAGRPPMMRPGRGGGFFAARQRMIKERQREEEADPFYLIKMELAISKKLQHPNLVHLYEVLNDSEQDVLYLIIDLCERGPVQKLDMDNTTAEPIPPDQSRKYFTQALLALEYLHEHDIVHRDLKPDNMLIDGSDTLNITDFGESLLLEHSDDKVTGSATGTPAFMAPELNQANESSEVSGTAADVWSLGVCLYLFVYGQLPFQGHNKLEILDNAASGELAFPPLPDTMELQDLIQRMLCRDPDARITIDGIRVHPWVEKQGLVSKEENCQNQVLSISNKDIDEAIQPIFDIMPVIKAVVRLRRFRQRFKEKKQNQLADQLENTDI